MRQTVAGGVLAVRAIAACTSSLWRGLRRRADEKKKGLLGFAIERSELAKGRDRALLPARHQALQLKDEASRRGRPCRPPSIRSVVPVGRYTVKPKTLIATAWCRSMASRRLALDEASATPSTSRPKRSWAVLATTVRPLTTSSSTAAPLFPGLCPQVPRRQAGRNQAESSR